MPQALEAAKSNRQSTSPVSYGRLLPQDTCGLWLQLRYPWCRHSSWGQRGRARPRCHHVLPPNATPRLAGNKLAAGWAECGRPAQGSPPSADSSGQMPSIPIAGLAPAEPQEKENQQLTFFSRLHLLFSPARAFIHFQRSWEGGRKGEQSAGSGSQPARRAQRRCPNAQTQSHSLFPRGTTKHRPVQKCFCRAGCRGVGSQGFSTLR